MGLAIDTIGFSATAPGSTYTAVTYSPGDSPVVRAYAAGSSATLEAITRSGATGGDIRVRSPLLHDNVQGIRLRSSERVSHWLMPRELGQVLQPQDTLTIELTGGTTSEVDAGAILIYYSNLPGASARLHSWGDVSGIIKSYKPIRVSVTTGATAGQWTDAVITASENLLHANTDYAVLGITVDTGVTAVALKGVDTSNLRVGCPGPNDAINTSDYFVELTVRHGTPHIPVFNSANAGNTYVSVLADTTGTSVTVTLHAVELTQNLP